jgi:hypothetical protein
VAWVVRPRKGRGAGTPPTPDTRSGTRQWRRSGTVDQRPDDTVAEPFAAARRVHHDRPQQRRVAAHLEPAGGDHRRAVGRHHEVVGHGRQQVRHTDRRQPGGAEQRDDGAEIGGRRRLQDDRCVAHAADTLAGFTARTNPE